MQIVRLNVAVGGLGIVFAGIGGMALGLTYDAYFKDGIYAVDIARALIKAGHTHGMPFALFNLIVGLALPHLNLGAKAAKACSWLAAAAMIMPLGLVLRGLDGGGYTFAPLGFGGAFCFMVAAFLLFWGALKKAA
jgi:hypothetical protein